MSDSKSKNFREKHGAEAQPDSAVRAEIEKRIKDKELPCAVAFEISDKTGVPIDSIGQTADLLQIRLSKCQLGLFGYQPNKKIVHAEAGADPKLSRLITEALEDGRLPCRAAWEIAARLKVSRLSVGNACESMKIKIKACQLGAF